VPDVANGTETAVADVHISADATLGQQASRFRNRLVGDGLPAVMVDGVDVGIERATHLQAATPIGVRIAQLPFDSKDNKADRVSEKLRNMQNPADGHAPAWQWNLDDVTFANHDYLLRSPSRRSAFTSALSVGAKTIS
jgi:hypothetical protein